MNVGLEQYLHKCFDLLSENWNSQNNKEDKATNFIYQCNTLDECMSQVKKQDVDVQYALHRWYNYKTSTECERIFCDYGAVHEVNPTNHDVDIYINGIPFDVKVTVYPAKLIDKPFDLKTREGKNGMIKWLYKNQSQQNRKQLVNRLYVVCDGKTSHEKLAMKSNFSCIKDKIRKFMKYSATYGINTVEIVNGIETYSLMSDVIYVV